MNETVKHNAGPNLMFAIPTLGRPVPLQWALNFKSLNPPINFNCDFNIAFGAEIGLSRQNLAETAIARGCKYLFFLGDDVVPPPHALRQLIYRLEHNPEVDVVGGIYSTKADPSEPLVFQGNGNGPYWEWKIGEFFECTGLGMDCTLIRTSVFAKLGPKPWFKTVDIDRHVDGLASVEQWTEDLFFCEKVTSAGRKIYADAAIICEHWDVFNNKPYRIPANSFPMRQKGIIKDKTALIIGEPIKLSDESFDVTYASLRNDPSSDYRVDIKNLPFDTEQFDFVVCTNPFLDVESILEELIRVSKKDGKVAVLIHHLLDREKITKIGFWSGKIDGDYLEFIKE